MRVMGSTGRTMWCALALASANFGGCDKWPITLDCNTSFEEADPTQPMYNGLSVDDELAELVLSAQLPIAWEAGGSTEFSVSFEPLMDTAIFLGDADPGGSRCEYLVFEGVMHIESADEFFLEQVVSDLRFYPGTGFEKLVMASGVLPATELVGSAPLDSWLTGSVEDYTLAFRLDFGELELGGSIAALPTEIASEIGSDDIAIESSGRTLLAEWQRSSCHPGSVLA